MRGGFSYIQGGIIRGDSTQKEIALVFTGDEFAEGGDFIMRVLAEKQCKASFFFTGRFFEQPLFRPVIDSLFKHGHYIGPHSYGHLLYCDWVKRDSLLIDEPTFVADLQKNMDLMYQVGIHYPGTRYFIPPFEWYNDSIATWSKRQGFVLFNFTPGLRTAADYTTPDMKNYRSSQEIYLSLQEYESSQVNGLNGFIILVHIGTDPRRTDKFYYFLPTLIDDLRRKGYQFRIVPQLLAR